MASKPRKKPIANRDVLKKLRAAGYNTYIGRKKSTDCFSTEWASFKKYSYSRAPNYRNLNRIVYTRDYMVPLDVYWKHITKRFKPQIKLGSMVRINQETSRRRQRNKFSQSVGVSQDFQHLGIGSGKSYESATKKSQIHSWRHANNSRLLIGNRNYPTNTLAAIQQATAYKNKGIKKKSRYSWNNPEITVNELEEKIIITGDGIFGHKKLINGYVTGVFVHFLYPKWETKRETRYEITLETGAKGIWTGDYIKRVYDTDFEITDRKSDGCNAYSSACPSSCTHVGMHDYTSECHCEPCFVNMNAECKILYDYTKLFNTTCNVGLDLKNEK